MRSKVLRTIGDQSGRKLFYSLHNDNDDVCRRVLDGLYGKMEGGHAVDVDARALPDYCQRIAAKPP